ELRGAERREIEHVDEQEFLRKVKVLLDQTIAEKRTRRIRQQTFVAPETDLSERRIGQRDRRAWARRIAKLDAVTMSKQRFVQPVRQLAFAAQIETEPLDGELRKQRVSLRPQPHRDRRWRRPPAGIDAARQ